MKWNYRKNEEEFFHIPLTLILPDYVGNIIELSVAELSVRKQKLTMSLDFYQVEETLQTRVEEEVNQVSLRNNLVSHLEWQTEDSVREMLASNKDDNLCLALKIKIRAGSDKEEESSRASDREDEESSRGSPYMILHSTKLFKVNENEMIF